MWVLIGTIASESRSRPVLDAMGSAPPTCACGAAEALANGMTLLAGIIPCGCGGPGKGGEGWCWPCSAV